METCNEIFTKYTFVFMQIRTYNYKLATYSFKNIFFARIEIMSNFGGHWSTKLSITAFSFDMRVPCYINQNDYLTGKAILCNIPRKTNSFPRIIRLSVSNICYGTLFDLSVLSSLNFCMKILALLSVRMFMSSLLSGTHFTQKLVIIHCNPPKTVEAPFLLCCSWRLSWCWLLG